MGRKETNQTNKQTNHFDLVFIKNSITKHVLQKNVLEKLDMYIIFG